MDGVRVDGLIRLESRETGVNVTAKGLLQASACNSEASWSHFSLGSTDIKYLGFAIPLPDCQAIHGSEAFTCVTTRMRVKSRERPLKIKWLAPHRNQFHQHVATDVSPLQTLAPFTEWSKQTTSPVVKSFRGKNIAFTPLAMVVYPPHNQESGADLLADSVIGEVEVFASFRFSAVDPGVPYADLKILKYTPTRLDDVIYPKPVAAPPPRLQADYVTGACVTPIYWGEQRPTNLWCFILTDRDFRDYETLSVEDVRDSLEYAAIRLTRQYAGRAVKKMQFVNPPAINTPSGQVVLANWALTTTHNFYQDCVSEDFSDYVLKDIASYYIIYGKNSDKHLLVGSHYGRRNDPFAILELDAYGNRHTVDMFVGVDTQGRLISPYLEPMTYNITQNWYNRLKKTLLGQIYIPPFRGNVVKLPNDDGTGQSAVMLTFTVDNSLRLPRVVVPKVPDHELPGRLDVSDLEPVVDLS